MSDPSDAAVYRPLSGWAIAGFGLAVLAALGIGLFAGVALGSGVPLLFDSTLFVLLALALAGFVLSLAGWVRIARAEGVRAGLGLARWGMLLSAFFGLGYLTWSVAKELAVNHESRAFTDAWLDRLRRCKSGSLDEYLAFAFLLAPEGRPPQLPIHDPLFEKQLRDRPALAQQLADYVNAHHAFGAGAQQRGLFPAFGTHDLVQLVSLAGSQAKIEPTGLRSWTYRGRARGGFHVEQSYEITTPEGTFPAVVAVLSSDTAEGRLWQVLFEGTELETGRQMRLTPLGENVLALRRDSREFARDWVRKLSQGLREEAFLDTLPARERPALRAKLRLYRPALAASAIAAPASGPFLPSLPVLASAETPPALSLPGFAAYAGGGLVHDATVLADPSVKATIGTASRRLFRPVVPASVSWPMIAGDEVRLITPWQAANETGEAIFWQPFGLPIPPELFCEGMIALASSDAAILAALSGPSPDRLAPLPTAQRPLRWRVVRVDVMLGTILGQQER
jgi:hypothetical protein